MRSKNPNRFEALVVLLVFAICLAITTILLFATVISGKWEYFLIVVLLEVAFIMTTLLSYQRYKEVSNE